MFAVPFRWARRLFVSNYVRIACDPLPNRGSARKTIARLRSFCQLVGLYNLSINFTYLGAYVYEPA